MIEELKNISGKKLRQTVNLIPDDVELWCGIGNYHSPIVEILRDIKNNRVIFANKTYLEDCVMDDSDTHMTEKARLYSSYEKLNKIKELMEEYKGEDVPYDELKIILVDLK